MLFTSPTFLFYFLPLVLILYLVFGRRIRNGLLLAFSLAFYAWGEPVYLLFTLLFIVLLNFLLGRWIEARRGEPAKARRILLAGVTLNLAWLAGFKILSAYSASILQRLGISLPGEWLATFSRNAFLPLGISFLTFTALAYLIDVYRQRCASEQKLSRFALYLLMFPKLIAGPIERYGHLSSQFPQSRVDLAGLAAGTRRFVIGFSKKLLIADTLAPIADQAFSLPDTQRTLDIAWLGLICYTMQIFFDFSGYTDMALGLGQMFGFKFIENFNYPYIAQSISDFWRRWHISLSSWFRDYLFYPLERKRRGAPGLAQYANVLIVFALTGLWHGITPNFLVWGLLHGLAISIEVAGLGRWLKSAWAPLRHLYTLAIVITGWVFFKAASLPQAFGYLKSLAGLAQAAGPLPFSATPIVNARIELALLAAVLLSAPLAPALARALKPLPQQRKWLAPLEALPDIFLAGLFLAAIIVMADSTYNAYIYFRF